MNAPTCLLHVDSIGQITLALPGLTPEKLGPDRFGWVLACLRLALPRYASEGVIGAVYDTAWAKIGYQIANIPNRLSAARILMAYEAAMQGLPMPWVQQHALV